MVWQVVVVVLIVVTILVALFVRNQNLPLEKRGSNRRKHEIIIPDEKLSRRKRVRSRKGKNNIVLHPYVELDYQLFYKPFLFPILPPEVETGNIEYKVRNVDIMKMRVFF